MSFIGNPYTLEIYEARQAFLQKDDPRPRQCCGTCRFFSRWDGTFLGECTWNLPTPAHIRRYGSAMMVAQPGHDFGEGCPAWEKGKPKVKPTKFSKKNE